VRGKRLVHPDFMEMDETYDCFFCSLKVKYRFSKDAFFPIFPYRVKTCNGLFNGYSSQKG
jgi:hypothetical protein